MEPGEKPDRIETERLVIRDLTASDAHPLSALWTDPAVTRYMGGPRNGPEVYAGLLEDASAEPKPVLDLRPVEEKASGRVIGHCGLLEKEVDGKPEVELVYVFAGFCWGKGYATEAAIALRNHAFGSLGIRRLIALIDPENTASARVAEKAGMTFERETVRPSGKRLRVYAVTAEKSPRA